MPDGPSYRKYRSGPRLGRGRGGATPLDELREERGAAPPAAAPGAPPAKGGRRVYGGRERRVPALPSLPRRRRRGLGPLSVGRLVRWLLAFAVFWLLLSGVLFLASATLSQEGGADAALGGAGYPLTSPNTVLVLGSDQRTSGTKEPGASTSGPSRSDSILLMRTGGGASARLSIPRDTIVDVPGFGRQKVNAAYALGGADLAVRTLEGYLGLEVNHLVEVDFENFPELIDAMGGIDYTGGCVVSRINGGFANGGYTLRLKRGTNRLDGRQALALARTRKNECNPRESDLTRARRQQKLFSAMKSRLVSPGAFVRLPWISWRAPRAIKSDMSGPTLLGLFGSLATAGSPPTRVLKPSGGETLPDGGSGLVVSEAERRAEVERFLRG